VLTWRGAKPKSGIEAAAREARYRLMGAWLVKNGIQTLCVGHTQDDQAETFLLRLARGSGLDGLSAMRSHAPWPVEGFESLIVRRPMLGISRADLRAHLEAIDQPWLDDPMNEDAAFDRVKIRKAAAALADAGLSSERIAAAAAHLARARAALEVVTEAVLARATAPSPKGLLLDPAALAGAPREIGLRALAAILMAVGGEPYRPRFDALERLFDRMAADKLGKGATLHGCHISPPPRDARHFGPNTLVVRAENPRKSMSSPVKPRL
jgi:tRNA(Ile)-lysidine synthase